jgi:hypothetical protein
MHIYRYGTLMRPPGPGAIPRKGLVSTNGQHLTTPTGHFAWGVADYNRELNQEEVDAYELEFVEETDAD